VRKQFGLTNDDKVDIEAATNDTIEIHMSVKDEFIASQGEICVIKTL
jgi:hypothetical protein